MASPLAPAVDARPSSETQPPASNTPAPRHLQREGACFFLSPAEQAMEDAMLRSSSPPAEPILGKRGHDGEEPQGGGDTEPDDPGPPTPRPAPTDVGHMLATCKHYTAKKKLRPEQCEEVKTFVAKDSVLVRQAKLYTMLIVLENKLDAQQCAAPPYMLSEDLKTNINNYGLAVMLSVHISAYKGDIPRNHVLDILKKYRFDLPHGIEHDLANWEKITAFVNYSLTQARARVKKLIRESIKNKINIFSLAQQIVHGTPCRPTIQLCARVALMRTIFVECKGNEKYWNQIDQRLQFIRSRAETSASRVTRAFNEILKVDRATYGAHEVYEIKDIPSDEWQQRVDDVVGCLSFETAAPGPATGSAAS